MKLVSLEDIGCQEPEASKCRKLSIQVLFSFLMLGDVLGASGTKRKEEEEANQNKLCTLRRP